MFDPIDDVLDATELVVWYDAADCGNVVGEGLVMTKKRIQEMACEGIWLVGS